MSRSTSPDDQPSWAQHWTAGTFGHADGFTSARFGTSGASQTRGSGFGYCRACMSHHEPRRFCRGIRPDGSTVDM